MYTLVVEHKYCKMTKTITGESIMKAYKENGLDIRIWKIIDIKND